MRRTLLPLLLIPALAAAPAPKARPRLVLVLSVDQLSAQLIQAYGPELKGGLGRLLREGASFTETYHDHGFTETGPGHSVLLSGRFPAHTGIVENTWLDRTTGKTIYCASDPAAKALHDPAQPGYSNARFLGECLGDWLQAQVPGSRVFTVSGKDRAAILRAGSPPASTGSPAPPASPAPPPTRSVCPRGCCASTRG